ncbi:unnamed protein product [Leuciscus chuanchicus]
MVSFTPAPTRHHEAWVVPQRKTVTPVNKQNKGRDEQKSDANDFEEFVYENDTPNTDKITKVKPINRPEVPKSQVHGPSLYITDDSNIALFPGPDGRFSTLDLIVRGHYEVHGESSVEDSSTGSVPATHPTRFSFHRPTSAAGSAAGSAARASANQRANLTKTFQRNIFIAELVDGKLETSTTLTVRFSEFEASVMGILYKVNDALEQEDSRILTDGQGNKILDSEGTRVDEKIQASIWFLIELKRWSWHPRDCKKCPLQ